MGLYNKLKGKIFPDEKEVLYFSSNHDSNLNNETSTHTEQKNNAFYSPSAFSQTRILSDKLKSGQTITIDVSNMERKEALRMIDFLGGVMYALDGDMKKISKNIFEFSIVNDEK